MKNMICRLVDRVSLKSCLIATAVFLFMLWLIDFSPIGVAGLLKVSNGVSILDYETRYSVDYAYDWLTRMGEAGRNFHLTKVMPLDIFYPPAFMLFMFSWCSLITKKITSSDGIIKCLPALSVIYLLLDWLENIGITAMLINFPVRLNMICIATGWITSIKKTVVLCILVIALTEIIAAVIIGLKGRAHAEIKG
ncbi:MAG: hypothetical protein K5668_08250 [Lachnospiraceae bacterium]|nr:hypothetical protein [Lachnospiraceae bacterium]